MGWSWKYFLHSTGKNKAAGWLTFVFWTFNPLRNWQLVSEGKWLEDAISFWGPTDWKFSGCNHLECLISRIRAWLRLWNLDRWYDIFHDVMCFSVGSFGLSSSSTNNQISVWNKIRTRASSWSLSKPPIPSRTQHTTWAVLIVLSTWQRTGREAQDPMKPRKGIHVKDCTGWLWLIAQSDGFHLAMLAVETRKHLIVDMFTSILIVWTIHQNQARQSRWKERLIFLLPDAFCLKKVSGQSPWFLCSFHALFFVFFGDAPQRLLVPVPSAVQWFADVRQVVNMCSMCRTRSVPNQALLVKWLMLGWDWNGCVVYHGKNHLRFLSCFSRFNSYFISYIFHQFPRSVHNAAFARERERESTSVRRVLTLKHKMFFPNPMNPKWVANTRQCVFALFLGYIV